MYLIELIKDMLTLWNQRDKQIISAEVSNQNLWMEQERN
jgi:hypothetical protein